MKLILRCVLLVASTCACTAIASEWTTPIAPFRVHGSTYYVGSQGLSSILITSEQGHVLIDVPMEENVTMIETNIRTLGFRVEDVRLILNSHAHFDHAGGIAKMAKISGARVQASRAAAKALRSGGDDADDPQHGTGATFTPVRKVKVFDDGATLRVDGIAVTAHRTPGHTPGSTTWAWRSCEDDRCLDMVYADSLTAMSNDTYRYTDAAHPERVADFRLGLKRVAALACDVLITPHPEVSGFLERVKRRDTGEAEALIDRDACRRYAETASKKLDARINEESLPEKRNPAD